MCRFELAAGCLFPVPCSQKEAEINGFSSGNDSEITKIVNKNDELCGRAGLHPERHRNNAAEGSQLILLPSRRAPRSHYFAVARACRLRGERTLFVCPHRIWAKFCMRATPVQQHKPLQRSGELDGRGARFARSGPLGCQCLARRRGDHEN